MFLICSLSSLKEWTAELLTENAVSPIKDDYVSLVKEKDSPEDLLTVRQESHA